KGVNRRNAGCTKGAQGSTDFCKSHGGGRRCTHPDCTKGAEGSTPFCKGHGGG
uniref:WRKY19-like zinc finger domain-containing protein n=1 Tax=Aegilops tauschii subsp. strangulata TaxID=200361 RepID=A0A453SFE1_AEGTS